MPWVPSSTLDTKRKLWDLEILFFFFLIKTWLGRYCLALDQKEKNWICNSKLSIDFIIVPTEAIAAEATESLDWELQGNKIWGKFLKNQFSVLKKYHLS